MRKILKKFSAICLVVSMMCSLINVSFAEEQIFLDTADTEQLVRVLDDGVTVFEGKLIDYDNGKWANINFNDLNVFSVFNWQSGTGVDIIPISAQTQNINASAMTTITTNSDDVKVDFIYYSNKGYIEKSIQDSLTYEVTVTNNSTVSKGFSPIFAVYDENGVLKKTVIGDKETVLPSETAMSTVTLGTSKLSDTDTIKTMVWNTDTAQAYIRSQVVLSDITDFYGDSTDNASLVSDISKPINGYINTADDIDYVKFIAPESTGYHISCMSIADISMQIFTDSDTAVTESVKNASVTLNADDVYYICIEGDAGDYTININPASSYDSSFDIYSTDAETGEYKEQLLSLCKTLNETDKEASKSLYNEYVLIEKDDIKLHALPEFLKNAPKNTANYDNLCKTYYRGKSAEFVTLKNRYKELLERYTTQETMSVCETEGIVPCGAAPPEIVLDDIEVEQLSESDAELSSIIQPSLTIEDTTSYSITIRVVFPSEVNSVDNAVYLYDFNTGNGLTGYYNAYPNCGLNQSGWTSGKYMINGLVPGGFYIVEAKWPNNNSIFRRVHLPYEDDESLTQFSRNHINLKMEGKDAELISQERMKEWLGWLDKAYEDFYELTGYMPFNGEKMEIKSSREDFNTNQPDGQNYWRIITGTAGNPIKISAPFLRNHMIRLKTNSDWGDSALHEISHNFDNDKWNFDAEVFAYLKEAYVLDVNDASVYRVDFENTSPGRGWYTDTDFYKFLKNDWFEGYSQSFAKGTYLPAGMAAVLLEIKNITGWDAFKETFRYFNDLKSDEVPPTEMGKINLFLSKLSDASGVDVFERISTRDKGVIQTHFDGVLKRVRTDIHSIGESASGRRANVSLPGGHSGVYQFTPRTSGNYTIYTSFYADTGVQSDTYIEVYDNAYYEGTPLAYNDDYGSGRFSRVSLDLIAGITYYIKVRNYDVNSYVHASLNIVQTQPDAVMTEGTEYELSVNASEFSVLKFTPSVTGAYTFYTDSEDAYLKLYTSEDLSERISQEYSRIIVYLKAYQTYYLQFMGYMMEDVSGNVGVRRAETIEFKKKSDSSFLYVNNPEYLTRWDIVDDADSRKLKIFEQKNVTGKNTFYQTHLSWYSYNGEEYSFPTQDKFYIGVDFYNPNNYNITVDVSRLVYTNAPTVLSNYVNNTGETLSLTVEAGKHTQLFDYTQSRMENIGPGFLGIYIIFDFTVKKASGSGVPDGEGVTVSSLAAYNYANLKLKDGEENRLEYLNAEVDDGAVIYNLENRPNEEEDLMNKYKGIARNQSNQIDASIEIAVDDYTNGDILLNLKSNEYWNGYYPYPQADWNTQINPFNDVNESIIHTTMDNLHKFTYHYDDTKQWHFDYMHRNTSAQTTDDNTTDSINQEIGDSEEEQEELLRLAEESITSGKKVYSNSLDSKALEIGSWGAVYHYTITVHNSGNKTKKIKVRIKPKANYTLVGKRKTAGELYEFKDNGESEEYWFPFEEEIPPGTYSFEIVTMSGLGDGGLEHTLIVNDAE